MPQFREKIIRDLHWVLESPNILRIDIEDCAQLSDAELLGGGAGGSGPPVVQAVELHSAVACDMTNEGGDVPLRLADSAKQSAASVVLVQAPPTVSVHV